MRFFWEVDRVPGIPVEGLSSFLPGFGPPGPLARKRMQVFHSLKEKVGNKVERIHAGLSDTVHAGKEKLGRHGGASDVIVVKALNSNGGQRNSSTLKSTPWIIHCKSKPSKELELLHARLIVNDEPTGLTMRVLEVRHLACSLR